MVEEKQEKQVIPVQELYTRFVDGFEHVWQVTKVGSLRCDRETRPRVASWFNTYRMMISVITGVDMGELKFDESQSELASVQNRVKMLEYYSVAYVAYLKYCQTMKREADAKFTDAKQCVDTSED